MTMAARSDAHALGGPEIVGLFQLEEARAESDLVSALCRALLEIEWTSRRSPRAAALRRINDIARAALRQAGSAGQAAGIAAPRAGATPAPAALEAPATSPD
jgi:hypothetical protein